MYKAIVFFDIDRTLLNRNQQLLPSSLKAIHLLKKNHVLPVIASGRNVSMIKPIVKKVHIHNAVCDNGSSLYFHNKRIAQETIKQDVLNQLVSISQKRHNPLAFQGVNQVAFNTRKRIPKKSIKRYGYPRVIPDFYKNHKVIYMSLFTYNHKDDHFYQQKFKNRLSFVRNCTVCLDVTNVGINKGTGVKSMIRKLHLDSVPSFCFGNGLNDIPMFKNVNYPIAMGNGQECKHYAKFITTDCDHDGIYNGLRHYNLIN